jgi:hypothetical protein
MTATRDAHSRCLRRKGTADLLAVLGMRATTRGGCSAVQEAAAARSAPPPARSASFGHIRLGAWPTPAGADCRRASPTPPCQICSQVTPGKITDQASVLVNGLSPGVRRAC